MGHKSRWKQWFPSFGVMKHQKESTSYGVRAYFIFTDRTTHVKNRKSSQEVAELRGFRSSTSSWWQENTGQSHSLAQFGFKERKHTEDLFSLPAAHSLQDNYSKKKKKLKKLYISISTAQTLSCRGFLGDFPPASLLPRVSSLSKPQVPCRSALFSSS